MRTKRGTHGHGQPKRHCIVIILSCLARVLNGFTVAVRKQCQYNDSICLYFHRKEGIDNWRRDILQNMIIAAVWSRASAAAIEAAAIPASGPPPAAARPARAIQANAPPAASGLPSAGPRVSAPPAGNALPRGRAPRPAGTAGGASRTSCPCSRSWLSCW